MRTLPSPPLSSRRRNALLATAFSALVLVAAAARVDAQAPARVVDSPAQDGSTAQVATAQEGASSTAVTDRAVATPSIAPVVLVRPTRAALSVRAQDRVTTHVSASESAPAPLLPRQDSRRSDTALMLVGAAAILVGALVDDDAGTVLIIGGAAVGLYGLYRFLN